MNKGDSLVRDDNRQRVIIQDSFELLPSEIIREYYGTPYKTNVEESNSIGMKKEATKHGIVIEKPTESVESYEVKTTIPFVKICIVTDDGVEKNYLDLINSTINKLECEVFTFILRNGESSKSLDNAIKLYQKLIKYKFQRNDLIIALGGGVVGDFSGFVASTYKRGTKFICIPTTVMSQADSSIGGKTAVNFYQEKNMIGTFYPASMVYVNTDTLKTLPDNQFYSGIAEIIKEGLCLDRELLIFLKMNLSELKNKDKKILMRAISWCNDLKNKIINQDPFEEKGNRQILNFGHTLGHALETISEYQLLHGEAIAVGILYAMLISMEKGNLQKNDLEDTFIFMKELHLFDNILHFLDKNGIFDELIQVMMNDKKNKQPGTCFVLLSEIGNAYTENISDRYFLENIWEQLVQLIKQK